MAKEDSRKVHRRAKKLMDELWPFVGTDRPFPEGLLGEWKELQGAHPHIAQLKIEDRCVDLVKKLRALGKWDL